MKRILLLTGALGALTLGPGTLSSHAGGGVRVSINVGGGYSHYYQPRPVYAVPVCQPVYVVPHRVVYYAPIHYRHYPSHYRPDHGYHRHHARPVHHQRCTHQPHHRYR